MVQTLRCKRMNQGIAEVVMEHHHQMVVNAAIHAKTFEKHTSKRVGASVTHPFMNNVSRKAGVTSLKPSQTKVAT